MGHEKKTENELCEDMLQCEIITKYMAKNLAVSMYVNLPIITD